VVSLTALAGRESTLTTIMRAIGRGARSLRARRSALAGAARTIARLLLTIGAMAMFTVAAFTVATVLGYVLIGVSLLVLEWLIKDAPRRERQ
jgi:hypothetical protein